MPPEVRDTITVLYEKGDDEPWQELLASLVMEAWGPEEERAYARFDPLIAELRKHADGAGEALSLEAIGVVNEALSFGASLGYALARTTPIGLEDLSTWLERGRAYTAGK